MQYYLLGVYNPVDNIVVCHLLFYRQTFFQLYFHIFLLYRLSHPKVVGVSVSEYHLPLVSHIQKRANSGTFLAS